MRLMRSQRETQRRRYSWPCSIVAVEDARNGNCVDGTSWLQPFKGTPAPCYRGKNDNGPCRVDKVRLVVWNGGMLKNREGASLEYE